MGNEKKEYLARFDVSPRARSLAGMHYEATYASRYWGKEGAIWVAKKLAEELCEDRRDKAAAMLLLSTYYSAGGSALQLWKKGKWKFWHLLRATMNTLQARHCGEKVLSHYVAQGYRFKRDLEAWDPLFFNLTLSELEVLMSPYWAIATKGTRLGFMVGRERLTALVIGYEALNLKKYEHVMSYALIAGKMFHLIEDEAERYKLKLVVMKATENKEFPAKDRARLHILLGEYEKAQALGEKEGLKDVVLKAGG